MYVLDALAVLLVSVVLILRSTRTPISSLTRYRRASKALSRVNERVRSNKP